MCSCITTITKIMWQQLGTSRICPKDNDLKQLLFVIKCRILRDHSRILKIYIIIFSILCQYSLFYRDCIHSLGGSVSEFLNINHIFLYLTVTKMKWNCNEFKPKK